MTPEISQSDPLSERLRRALTVPDATLDRLVNGVSESCKRRRRQRVLSIAAAALGLVAATAWLLTQGNGSESASVARSAKAPALEAPSIDPDDPVVWDIRASLDEGGSAYDEEPGIGWLLEESDGVVFGEVKRLQDGLIRFEVRFSQPTWLAQQGLRSLPRDGAYPEVSCSRALSWKPGERVWLFLKRHPETKQLEVVRDGSGKIEAPLYDLFEDADIRDVVRRRRLSDERLASLIDRHGAEAILYVESMMSWLPEWREPWGTPVLQAAIQNQLSRFAAAGSEDIPYPAVALRKLQPERWLALPTAAREEIRRRFEAIEEPWSRLAWLEGLHRFRDARGDAPYAPDVTALVARAEADFVAGGGKTGYRERLRESLRLSLAHDRERAVARLWELTHEIEESSFWGPIQFLEPLLQADRERAEAELVRMMGRDRPRRRPLRLDLLAACEGTAGIECFQEWLTDEDFDFGSMTYLGQLERALVRDPDADVRFERFRDFFRRLLGAPQPSLSRFVALVEIQLAQGEDLAPAVDQLRRWLLRADGEDLETLARLVRRVQERLGVQPLLWRDPTRTEVIAAAKDLLTRLMR